MVWSFILSVVINLLFFRSSGAKVKLVGSHFLNTTDQPYSFFSRISRALFLFLALGSAFLLNGNKAMGQCPTSVTPGNGIWTVPAGVTSITVEAWGGGGGGSGRGTSNGSGGGGGGGAYSRSILTVTPLSSLNVIVGNGGTSNNNGGNSFIFFVTSDTLVRAEGGLSSGLDNPGGARGGIIGNGKGIVRFNGGNGFGGTTTGPRRGGGGGGGAGPLGIGADGVGRAGGTNTNGGGSGGTAQDNPNSDGNPGFPIGGGGSGAAGSSRPGGAGANGLIRITYNTTPGAIASAQTICSGGDPAAFTNITAGTGLGPITYRWESAVSPFNSWSTIIGATAATYDAPAGLSTTTQYRRVTIANGTCESTATAPIQVTVNPLPAEAGTITGTAIVCQGQTGVAYSVPAIANATSYIWSYSGIGFTPSGTTNAITGSFAANATSGNLTVQGVNACGNGTVSTTYAITINETPAIKSQNTPGGTTCINGATFAQMSVGTGFGYTYQWYSNSANNNTTGTPISGAVTNTYTPLNTTAGSLYYYVIVSSPSCSPITSQVSAAYIVNPNNTVTLASASPTVCVNSAFPSAITHTTTGSTAIGAIAWSPSNPGGMSASFTGNTISISGTPATSGVFSYSIPLTGGCGTVNATGTITVNAVPITIPSANFATNQSRCINASPGFNALSVESRTGFSYQWYRNTSGTIDTSVDTEVGTNTNSYTPLNDGTVPQTSRYYVVVTSSTSCGSAATSALSGVFTVNPLPIVSFTDQPSSPTCVDIDVTYSTQTGKTNYVWTIPGILGTDYSISSMSGATLATSHSITLQYKTAGNKSIQVNYTDAQGCGTTSPETSNSITVQKNTVTPPSAYPSVCLNGTITPFTHTTTLATGIGAPSGLPDGLTAGFSGNTITISGTITGAVTPGFYNYTIPITGGCGTVSATGTVEVTPVYTLSTITSVSPSATGGNATVTITGDPTILINGTYQVTYSMGLANTSGPTTTTVVITNGKGSFSTLTIGNEDLTSLTISQIKKDTDACFIPITSNNITFFGIRSAVYTANGTFYVPAGIFQITIKVWGGGGGGGKASNGAGGGGGGYTQVTIPVTPGEPIGMYIGSSGNGETNSPATAGGNSYATRDPAFPSSLAFANGGSAASGNTFGNGGTGQTNNGQNGSSPTVSAGGKGGNGGGSNGGTGGPGGTGTGSNPGEAGTAPGGGGGGSDGNRDGGNGGQGLILISYPLPPVGPCFKVIDDGSKSRTSIIEFTCDDTWIAPEGLAEFTVVVGSGGGGGGSGEGSGGGGSGALIRQTFNSSNPYGLPEGTSFEVVVGSGGLGATAGTNPGFPGSPSAFTGDIDGNPVNIYVEGGGGGGSQSSNSGAPGASGGGGGARRDDPLTPQSSGVGGSAINITYTGTNVTVYNGNVGGNGDATDVPNKQAAIAGGGGGGLVPWIQADRPDGKAAGLGQGEGGDGGKGITLTMGDSLRQFGAGGGGIGEYFNGTEKVGIGGSANGVKLGGDGNLDNSSAIGGVGKNKTGSGGGAGYGGGGRGGNGIVYIYYENFRILPVEFISFDAKLDQANRSSDISWVTAKEWESSHFEIERSVNGVGDWNKVGELEAQGYSEIPTEYNYSDSKLPASGGIVYYRLKQVDFNGKFSYSNTKSIKVEALIGSGAWIAYPNPSSKKNVVTLDLINSSVYSDEPILIRISDIKGVSETYTVNKIEAVSEVVNAYLDRSISGVYILQLVWGNKSQQLKLLRQ